MYYFYILCSERDNKLYKGYTENLRKRLKQHNSGNVPATKPRRPLKLIYYSAFLNKYDSLDAERYFKSSAGKRRIKQMLKNHFAKINQ
ncbi:GIY-YIG nuclease family protein [Patescibacteria group bacterium]|nr:GIY-YIG nuclease family protein [Patescibacteria group bacterium]